MKEELELDVQLKPGPSGSYVVEVDGRAVIRKESLTFPTEEEVVAAVARALQRRPGP